jgi:hypothetical protein
MDARDIFEKYVSKLNHKDRQELLDLMTGKLPTETRPVARRSQLKLEGVGSRHTVRPVLFENTGCRDFQLWALPHIGIDPPPKLPERFAGKEGARPRAWGIIQ